MVAPDSDLSGLGTGGATCLRCGAAHSGLGRNCRSCSDSVETLASDGDEPLPRTSGLIAVPPALDDDGMLGPGTEVDAYFIEYLLGSGGVGNVYAARHGQLDREVALKHLRPDVARNAKIVQRFFDEARAANRVRHENIVEITDFREHDRFGAYLIMERLEGQDLADLIYEMGQAIPLDRVLRIAKQTASALGAAHSAGVVHRDLKPDNIFLTVRGSEDSFVKVLDFGVAKLGEGIASVSAFETAAGTLLGTPAYMSPEQAMGQKVDSRSDIYALGVIMFEMLTGTLPFDAETAGEFIILHATSEPLAIATFRQDVPASLVALIERCMAKAPADRPGSMLEVEATLDQIMHTPGPAALAPPPTPKFDSDLPTQPPEGSAADREATTRVTVPMPEPSARRSPWMILGPAIAFSLLALGTAFWIASGRRDPAPSVATVPTQTRAPVAPEPSPELDEPGEAAERAGEPAQPAEIEVVFRSTPPGATVRLEGREDPLGQTPLSTTLPADDRSGRFTFELEGYRPHAEELSLERSILASVRLDRVPRRRRPAVPPSQPSSRRPTGRRGVLSF